MSRRLAVAAALTALAAAVLGAGVASGKEFTIVQIPPPGNADSTSVLDINLFGQATGILGIPSGSGHVTHAFRFDPVTGVTDLGTLGGINSLGFAINSNGLVAGASQVAGSNNFHPFLFTPGVGMKDLGTGSGTAGFAFDVSESGDVIGNFFPGTHSFLWTPSAGFQDEGVGAMRGFNFVGTIFGYANGVPGEWKAPFTTFSPFGAVPSPYSNGFGAAGNIFDEEVGTLTGTVNGGPAETAFLWDGHQYTPKLASGFKFSDGTAIDNAGDFLWTAFNSTGPSTPFINFFGQDTPVNGNTLDPPGSPFSTFFEFNSITDLGQIGGTGQVGSQERGFILTPPAEIQLNTVRTILETGTSGPDADFIKILYTDLLKRPVATQCTELNDFTGALGSLEFPTPGQGAVGAQALEAYRNRLQCPSGGTPSAPIVFPHVFTHAGQRETELVKVGPGTLVIQAVFPNGSTFDVTGIRETGKRHAPGSVAKLKPGKLKITKTKGKTFVRAKVSKLKRGTLHFTVVTKKLLNGKPTPVTTKVS